MDCINGFELFSLLKKDKKFNHIPFIFLTAQLDEKNIEKALDMGAVDFIEKPFKIELLIKKVSAIFYNLERQKFALLEHAHQFILQRKSQQTEGKTFLEKCDVIGLTRREMEICQLLIQDCSIKEASSQLNISSSTVKKHIQKIYTKAGVSSRVGLLKLIG